MTIWVGKRAVSIASSIKNFFKIGPGEILGLILGLALAQGISFLFHLHEIKTAEVSIRSILNRSEFSSNPYKAAQALESIEALDIIRCSTFAIENENPFYSSVANECDHGTSIFRRDLDLTIASFNGQKWNLKAKVITNRATAILLIGLNCLFCLLGFSLVKLFRSQMQLKDLEGRANKEVADMARKVAHDIRSPLSALNALSGMSQDLKAETKEVIVSVVERINGIAEGLLSHSKNLKPIQRIEGKKGTEVLESIRKISNEKRALYPTFEIRIDSKVERSNISIDKVTWERILSNLIDNAVEASNSQKIVSIQVFNTAEYINVVILDFGQGIEEDVLNQLGKRRLTTKGSQGNGIGLYSSVQAIHAAGGDLKIQSKIGVGTQVSIRFVRTNS